MDPQVIQQLLARRSGDEQSPVSRLTPREREVLELMAQGRSNTAIAGKLVVTERAVAKHTANIFVKLGLEVSDDDNRRYWRCWPIWTVIGDHPNSREV